MVANLHSAENAADRIDALQANQLNEAMVFDRRLNRYRMHNRNRDRDRDPERVASTNWLLVLWLTLGWSSAIFALIFYGNIFSNYSPLDNACWSHTNRIQTGDGGNAVEFPLQGSATPSLQGARGFQPQMMAFPNNSLDCELAQDWYGPVCWWNGPRDNGECRPRSYGYAIWGGFALTLHCLQICCLLWATLALLQPHFDVSVHVSFAPVHALTVFRRTVLVIC